MNAPNTARPDLLARLRSRWRDRCWFRLNRMPAAERQLALWQGNPPADRFDTWDVEPWRHSWLTPENLRAMRDYSEACLERWRHQADALPAGSGRYAFVGNLANNMYMRARPLRRLGLDIDVFVHPQDHYVMSQPGWEELDAVVDSSETDVRRLGQLGVALPDVPGVYQPPVSAPISADDAFRRYPHLSAAEVLRWLPYLSGNDWIADLAGYDALLCAQSTFVGLLSGRPYLAAHIGGEIWYECSRGDLLGRLQLESYRRAAVVLASNPLSFAHARRYGLHNAVYVPLLVDEDLYAPGPGPFRQAWMDASGGNFFVFSAVRQNDAVKGTLTGLEGFARFAARHRGARLVIIEWGQQSALNLDRFAALGIADKVVRMPIAGKRRVVDYLRSADCSLDQFTIGYYGASALEAMGCGLPVVMRLERAQYAALCRAGAPPVVDAATPDEVEAALERLASDTEFRRAVAEAQREWLVAAHGAKAWYLAVSAMLRVTAAGRRDRYARSPLRAPLSPEEHDYHARGLARAPQFPYYQ